jgi:polyhydroxyalkanoate synthesis regulator protein
MAKDLVIRKNSHRRYYDSSRGRYIRLSEIADLIRAGAHVTARDWTGRDIAGVLMARIIVHEQTKTRGGPLTTDAMRMLIRLVGPDLSVCLGSLAAFLESLPADPSGTNFT